jgi:hypothetical protein
VVGTANTFLFRYPQDGEVVFIPAGTVLMLVYQTVPPVPENVIVRLGFMTVEP